MMRGGWNEGYAHPCAPTTAGNTTPTAMTARATTRRIVATGFASATGSELRAALRIQFSPRGLVRLTCYRLAKRVRGSGPKQPAPASELTSGAASTELVTCGQTEIARQH